MHLIQLLRRATPLVAACFLFIGITRADEDAPINWNKARQLHQQAVQGMPLSEADRAYLERAMAERRAHSPIADVLAQLPPDEQAEVRVLIQKRQTGEPLTDGERALQQKVQTLLARHGGGPAAGIPPQPPRDHTGLVPLSDMTPEQTYHGLDGGLYGGGHNVPPAPHVAAAAAAANRIVPLDASGNLDNRGRIVLLSVGMSNTTQEFSRFKEFADADPAKSQNVVIVDGAQGGQAAAQWAAAPDSAIWHTVATRLSGAGVTPRQVEAVWLKQAEIRPTEPFPNDAHKLADDEATIVQMLSAKFPNLRIVYLSSRIYGGYATTALNPEPYAYESAFAVRELIQRQIAGDPTLNFDRARGPLRAPLLLWGPYLWADGVVPRKSDGLVWLRQDLREDGTHPSVDSGRTKVARLLLAFFKTDPTAKCWFARGADAPQR